MAGGSCRTGTPARGQEEKSRATKADFTPDDWQILEWAVTEPLAYISMADPGLWDTFKEAKGAAKSMVEITTTGDSACVRDLAGKMKAKQDKDVSGNAAGVTGEALERVGQAVRIVSERAPENLDAVESLIIGAATASAEAAHGAALLGVSLSAPEVSLRRYGVARRRKP